jgi:hypothetical protein
LEALLKALSTTTGIHTLRISPNAEGVAIKLNEGMWSAPIGKTLNRG